MQHFLFIKKITDKLFKLFGTLNTYIEDLLAQYAAVLPAEVTASKGKVNRGENYELQPYVILDSPRLFLRCICLSHNVLVGKLF